MSIDDVTNGHHQDMIDNQDHPGWSKPIRQHPINRGDEKDRYLEGLAEQIHIARHELAGMEAEYERVRRVEVEHDPDPGFETRRPAIDPRMFDMGTDASEEWRSEEAVLPRSVISVETGGRT